jgi:hypothetical protein
VRHRKSHTNTVLCLVHSEAFDRQKNLVNNYLYEFSVTLFVVEAVVSFIDFDFLNPNWELLRKL